MRITVTAVDLSNAWSADVLVDADPELPVSALAQHRTLAVGPRRARRPAADGRAHRRAGTTDGGMRRRQ